MHAHCYQKHMTNNQHHCRHHCRRHRIYWILLLVLIGAVDLVHSFLLLPLPFPLPLASNNAMIGTTSTTFTTSTTSKGWQNQKRTTITSVPDRFKTNVPNHNNDKTVVIAGATGYIGRAVVQEAVKRGYNTVALVRNATWLASDDRARLLYGNSFEGATVQECNVQDLNHLKTAIASLNVPCIDSIISCLASPSGTKKDVYEIDYQATFNCLQAGQHVQARHFVLLSAFCCRKPLLQLQQAKLQLESQLAAQSIMTWSVVRPTAYFKSISGQLDAIRAGAPYVLFGDGAVTQCNPIAESELAEFMLDCLVDESKLQQILNVGGPDQPLTNQMLGEVSWLYACFFPPVSLKVCPRLI